MKQAKLAVIILTILAGVIAFLVVLIPLTVIDKLYDEERDYKLSDEMHKLAKELKYYKAQCGKYPEGLLQIRKTDRFCDHRFYTKCRKIYYKPSQDLQDFKMAAYSFTWVILYYHPQVSMTPGELGKSSKTEQEKLKFVCFFCAAIPPTKRELQAKRPDLPIYREDKTIFSNPEEWPVL